MKKAILILLLFAGFAKAQEKPAIQRTVSPVVVADLALKANTFFGPPSGTVPSLPSFVLDADKCGALFNVLPGTMPPGLYRYNCTTSAWEIVSGSGGSTGSGLIIANGVTSGLGLSISGSILTVQPGTWNINSVGYSKNSISTFTLAAQDPVLNRIDMVYATPSNTIGVVTGTSNVNPINPGVPSGDIAIGEVYVTPSAYNAYQITPFVINNSPSQIIQYGSTYLSDYIRAGNAIISDNFGQFGKTSSGNYAYVNSSGISFTNTGLPTISIGQNSGLQSLTTTSIINTGQYNSNNLIKLTNDSYTGTSVTLQDQSSIPGMVVANSGNSYVIGIVNSLLGGSSWGIGIYPSNNWANISSSGVQSLGSPVYTQSNLLAGTGTNLRLSGGNYYIDATATGNALALVPTAVKTANYTAALQDFIPVNTTSGSITITLPTAPADKTQIGVKHIIQGSTNTVTIITGGSDVLNKAGGNTSLVLPYVNQGIILQYASGPAIWYVVADDLPKTALDAIYATQTNLTAETTRATTQEATKQATLSGTGYVKSASGTISYTTAIPNSDLANSVTNINGTAVPLGGSITIPTFTSPVTTNGDIFIYNGGNSRLPIGSNGQFLSTVSGLPAWVTGVNSASNSDGTLTISPTTGLVVASLNLNNPNVWTPSSGTKFQQNGIGTGSADGILLSNNTLGTSSATLQNSARAHFQANQYATVQGVNYYDDAYIALEPTITTASGAYSLNFYGRTNTTGTGAYTLLGGFTQAGAFNTSSVSTTLSISAGQNVIATYSLLAPTTTLSTTKTTVNASTSGTATCDEPELGSGSKRVKIYFSSFLGTGTYTFPTAFLFTPAIIATDGVSATVVSSKSTTSISFNSSSAVTGFMILEGF